MKCGLRELFPYGRFEVFLIEKRRPMMSKFTIFVVLFCGLIFCAPAAASTVLLSHTGDNSFTADGWADGNTGSNPGTLAGEICQMLESTNQSDTKEYYLGGLAAANPGVLTQGWTYEARVISSEGTTESGANQITMQIQDGVRLAAIGVRGGNSIEYYDSSLGGWQADALTYGTGWNDYKMEFVPGDGSIIYSMNGTTFATVANGNHYANTGDSLYFGAQNFNGAFPVTLGVNTVAFTMLPEPATLAVLAVGGLLTLVRRRRS
jgi:hypothetical protein